MGECSCHKRCLFPAPHTRTRQHHLRKFVGFVKYVGFPLDKQHNSNSFVVDAAAVAAVGVAVVSNLPSDRQVGSRIYAGVDGGGGDSEVPCICNKKKAGAGRRARVRRGEEIRVRRGEEIRVRRGEEIRMSKANGLGGLGPTQSNA